MAQALAKTAAPPPTAPSRSARRRTRRLVGLGVALGALLVAVLLSVAIGSALLPPDVVWQALTAPDGSASHATVSGARVDRTLLGIVVGLSLGVAGALMQALTRNPLADPGVLGVNAGAGFAVTLGVAVFGVTRIEQYLPFALVGAVVGAAFVYLAASGGRGGPTPVRLTLVGVAFTAVLVGISQTLALIDTETFDRMRFWGRAPSPTARRAPPATSCPSSWPGCWPPPSAPARSTPSPSATTRGGPWGCGSARSGAVWWSRWPCCAVRPRPRRDR